MQFLAVLEQLPGQGFQLAGALVQRLVHPLQLEHAGLMLLQLLVGVVALLLQALVQFAVPLFGSLGDALHLRHDAGFELGQRQAVVLDALVQLAGQAGGLASQGLGAFDELLLLLLQFEIDLALVFQRIGQCHQGLFAARFDLLLQGLEPATEGRRILFQVAEAGVHQAELPVDLGHLVADIGIRLQQLLDILAGLAVARRQLAIEFADGFLELIHHPVDIARPAAGQIAQPVVRCRESLLGVDDLRRVVLAHARSPQCCCIWTEY